MCSEIDTAEAQVHALSEVGYKEVLSALQVENAKSINIRLVVAEKKRKQEKLTAEGHLNKSQNVIKVCKQLKNPQ